MNKKGIQKPISIIKQEFAENITQQINNSKLPLFIIEYILKEILDAVHAGSIKQLECDIKAYQEQIENSKTEK